MVNLRKISKKELGKELLPEKIFFFKFKDELERLHEKIYFDNLNHILFTNMYAVSFFISIFFFFFSYDFVYALLNDWFYTFLYRFLIIFFTFAIINFIVYYVILFIYFFLHESKFRKSQQDIEVDLPDFLDSLVSNLKGGIPFEKALLKSVRKEQKALLLEVTLINQKILMGKTVAQALREFRKRYDSHVVSRTVFLIEEGIKNGGNIAVPLERISENLKRIYNLDEEMKANAGGFTTVIKSISIFVGPLLFALALTLLTFIGQLFAMIVSSGQTSISVSEVPSEYSDYLIIFSYAMIILITLFSSLITAELKNEKMHDSIKYIPIYVIIAIIVFKIASSVLLSFFGNIL